MSWSQVYGLMAILTVAVAFLSHREHLQKTAGVLFATWALSNIIHKWLDLPMASYLFPVLDIAAAIYVFRVTIRHKSVTTLIVLALFVAMGAAHVWYHYLLWLGHVGGGYALLLNILFACQLAVVTTGAGHWAVSRLRLPYGLRHARGGGL